jgi:hypothetical protein
LQSQWAKLAGFIIAYQATWIADIVLKTGLFQAIADAGDGITDTDIAAGLELDPRYVQNAGSGTDAARRERATHWGQCYRHGHFTTRGRFCSRDVRGIVICERV